MNREKRLSVCGNCVHRSLDFENGYLCNLTGEVGTFEDECKDFFRDGTVTDSLKLKVRKPEEKPPPVMESVQRKTAKSNERSAKRKLSKDARIKLRKYQSFIYALTGGIIITVVAAIVWSALTAASAVGWSLLAQLTSFPEIYLSVGIGLVVGLSVRFFGAGISRVFGLLSGVFTLAGCLLGSYLIREDMVPRVTDMGYREAALLLRPELIVNSFLDSFVPPDLMIYGLAALLAYFLSIRRIGTQKRLRLNSDDYSGAPLFYRLRLPLIIAGILVPVYIGYTQMRSTSGKSVQFSESGWKMSEGRMKLNRESGEWTYWYENGDEKCSGFYVSGLRDSLWQWHDRSGRLAVIGRYRKGVEDGIWIHYDENGNVSDSGSFVNGYREGIWSYWYPNGKLRIEGEMKRGKRVGLWKVFHYNGRTAEELLYNGTDPGLLQNVWDPGGHQTISEGNGEYRRYSRQGGILEKGEVREGKRAGTWTRYYSNGKICEEGIYLDGRYLVRNSWGMDGSEEVLEGNGAYHGFYEGSTKLMETGEIRNGAREGLLKSYYRNTGTLWEEVEYIRGNQTGLKKLYNESGELLASGMMRKGLREGEWNIFLENGQTSATVTYKGGTIQEKQLLTNTPDIILSEEHLLKGILL